jgi:hypothetical protein
MEAKDTNSNENYPDQTLNAPEFILLLTALDVIIYRTKEY